ncbi:hypothetical protein KUTeg_024755 [Tegillarca granosa]|uniref:PDZ domain-containing protein 8 n=1 Tax=Tegillarca granosa TaxID=220873 RepID=A0ABQ9DYS7_TEGGR|nr:hypothetical protein KUTeg_024755 [Tegillarca granosa]
MLDAVVVCSFILGIVVTLLLQYLIFRRYLSHQPFQPVRPKQQFPRFTLPQELLKLAKDPEQIGKKESCISFNLICQFLFKELKDTRFLRQWAVRKMNVELSELLTNTTTGKVIDQISVREFSLGNTFPVIKSVAVHNVIVEKDTIEEVDVVVELDYSGGFQLSVDIDLVFSKCTYLSVLVTNLRGSARLRFTRQPCTHWSFLFLEEPRMDFTVESRFGTRPLPQITSLIINQIKRVVRKRHTLPNYKFRYKPFFDKYIPFEPANDIYLHGKKLGQGQLEVTVMECSRLKAMPSDSSIYCTLSVEILRGQATSIGMTFKEDFILEKYEDAVVVDEVIPDSPAGQADLKKGDIIVSVGTSRVTSMKQAKKLFKNAGERFNIRVERPKSKAGQKEPQFSEETLSLKDFDGFEKDDRFEHGDDFVNISLKQCDTDVKQVKEIKDNLPANDRSPQKRLLSVVNTGKALLQRKTKSHPEAAAPVTQNIVKQTLPEDKTENGFHSDVESLSDEEDVCDMKRTREVMSCQNPVWNQKFTFDVDEDHKYLNVCVWCRSPEKLDKHDRVVKPGKEILMGHKTLSLTDVALECLMTLQCDTQQTINLVPPELRAGAR